jgi:DHA2 family methylenomycin A resistance protein-like MFS transporter
MKPDLCASEGAPHSAALPWALCATSFGFTAVQLDVTIVNVALPRIAADLHTEVAGLQWVVDAYALAFAVLLLSAGALADRMGPRRAYLAGFALFMLASAACGFAGSALQLIVARALQGLGAALLVPSSLALLSYVYAHDAHQRARAVGWWTAAGGVSIAAGPVLGGLLLDVFGWRSIFWVNLPVCTLGILLTLRVLPDVAPAPVSDAASHSAPGARRRPLDPLGQLLAVAALTGLTGAVIEAGHLGWQAPLVWCGYALGAGAGLLFVRVENQSPAPMLPLGFFRLPNFTPAVGYGIAVNLTYYGVIFLISLYLQRACGYSPIRAGLAYLPLTATFIGSNIVSGRLTARFGPRVPMVAGACIGMSGYLLLLRLSADSAFAAMLLPFILIPGGMGLGVPAMTGAILGRVGPERAGTAAAVLNAARQTGGAIGVAAFGALVGGEAAGIVPALHRAALCSALLLGAAALGASAIHRHRPARRQAEHVQPKRGSRLER